MAHEFRVDKVAVICTCHVSEATSDWLTAEGPDTPAMLKWKYGWQLYVSNDFSGFDEEVRLRHPEVLNLLRWAHRKGFDWVRLDPDADVVPGLPILR